MLFLVFSDINIRKQSEGNVGNYFSFKALQYIVFVVFACLFSGMLKLLN